MLTIPNPTIRHFDNAADFRKHFVVQEQIDKYLPGGKHFIDDAEIEGELARAKAAAANDKGRVREILAKSLAIKTLSPDEVATLIYVTDPELLQEMRETALKVKQFVYDNRLVVFAPLYISNYCVNRCAYCGFRSDNCHEKRRMLTMDELKEEIDVLAGKIGHKRIIAVFGEHNLTSTDYYAESIQTIYNHVVKAPSGAPVGIRRANINAAPLPIEDLKVLHEVGIGTFQVFQETYHRPTYELLHPADTIKGNYDWRTTCFHRCQEAGVDDVGMGVLYGLYDWKYELLACVHHAIDLEKWFNIGPHTVSFPRLQPASGTDVPEKSPYIVSDEDFLKIVTIMRLAVPYTGLIVTARERKEIRDLCADIGMTQLDCSSNIAIKGYSDFANVADQEIDRQQFMLGDPRSLDDVVRAMAARGRLVSFCTAGYRCGRTGGCIMDALKTGREGHFCKINAVLTMQEWLDDFASPETRAMVMPLVQKELDDARAMFKPAFYETIMDHYNRIRAGERDLFF